MLDPFPYRSPPALVAISKRIGALVNFDTLYLHSHEIILIATTYFFIGSVVSPPLSRLLSPKIYPNLPRRSQLNWDVHVVSFLQSVMISGVALWCMQADRERANMDWRERVWGYTGCTGLVQALAAGYFLWDLYISITHVSAFGLGMLAHAVSAFWVFTMGFRPFVNFYAPTFILYELSTPFLNIHWFCDKLNMTGSNLQFYNGLLLMLSFFGSRLVWGVWATYRVFSDVFKALDYQHTPEGREWLELSATTAEMHGFVGGKAGQVMRYAHGKEVPTWLAYTYLASNAVLTMLNVYWFAKMIQTIRSRFEPPLGTKKVEKKPVAVVGRGIDENGVKSVDVKNSEVRKRLARSAPSDYPPPT